MKTYIWYFIKIILQCTWGSVQTLIGLAFFLVYRNCSHELYRGCVITKWNSLDGISLGLFLFIPDDKSEELLRKTGGKEERLKEHAERTLVHEYGHTFQSLMLGPFMLIPGLTSVAWSRMKKYEKLRSQYGVPYSFCWTESWANKLGEKATGKPSI